MKDGDKKRKLVKNIFIIFQGCISSEWLGRGVCLQPPLNSVSFLLFNQVQYAHLHNLTYFHLCSAHPSPNNDGKKKYLSFFGYSIGIHFWSLMFAADVFLTSYSSY